MLEFQNVCFSYGKKSVLTDVSFHLAKGEILAVMGESGCGKTTLLRLVAGLIEPKSGVIRSDAKQICYVFQEPRLFPWLTVAENIRAVLSDTEHADERIASALETVGLAHSASLFPSALSGGMKSRASLARAIAYGGDLFLLDEPFAALNEELRNTLAATLRKEFQEKGISAILVTHQLSDAVLLADRIIKI